MRHGEQTFIKLIVDEPGSERAAQIWESADALAAVTLIEVEARAALASAARSNRVTPVAYRRSRSMVTELLEEMQLVEVTHSIVAAAGEVAETDGLRASDAVHLTAALVVGVDVFTSADRVLCGAAAARGLPVANPDPSA